MLDTPRNVVWLAVLGGVLGTLVLGHGNDLNVGNAIVGMVGAILLRVCILTAVTAAILLSVRRLGDRRV